MYMLPHQLGLVSHFAYMCFITMVLSGCCASVLAWGLSNHNKYDIADQINKSRPNLIQLFQYTATFAKPWPHLASFGYFW